MATASSAVTEHPQRRVVLIDFDWHDADLLPELLAQPGFTVRLVAGEKNDDAGVRVAELCGMPRTVDLADLTREIFDLALVSERSPRRTQVEGLLLALGTPCLSPEGLLQGEAANGDEPPAIEVPLALHAAALETALGGEPFEDILEQSLPDVDVSEDAPTMPQPVRFTGQTRIMVPSLENFPSPEDRRGLELALQSLVAGTGAGRAELHTGRPDKIELVAQVGPSDPLLKGLVDLAFELGTAQVVSPLSGPHEGKAWGAWPFQTTQRRGVLAAGKIDPARGWTTWERMVEELKNTWDEKDREQAGPAFPMLPGAQTGWLELDAFRTRLDLAIDRNARDGLRFAVHRLQFVEAPAAVETLCHLLPDQLRDTDCICRPLPSEVLLLTAGAADAFAHVRRRLLALWEHAWRDSGAPPPAPPITDERIEMSGPEDAEQFLGAVQVWLTRS